MGGMAPDTNLADDRDRTIRNVVIAPVGLPDGAVGHMAGEEGPSQRRAGSSPHSTPASRRKELTPLAEAPVMSVVLPTDTFEKLIRPVLDRLLQQTVKYQLEVWCSWRRRLKP